MIPQRKSFPAAPRLKFIALSCALTTLLLAVLLFSNAPYASKAGAGRFHVTGFAAEQANAPDRRHAAFHIPLRGRAAGDAGR